MATLTQQEEDILALPPAYESDKEEDVDVSEPDSSAAKTVSGTPLKDSFLLHSATFKEFLLRPELLRSITDAGYEHPSAVQNRCIPQALMGTDILCQAKAGTGKTAVFVTAIIQQLASKPRNQDSSPEALVIAPTRELADQILHEFSRFLKYLPSIRVAACYGGLSIEIDRQILKDSSKAPAIVVGTPGRLFQLIREKSLNISKCGHFVLDECDKMLDALDMRKTIQSIFLATQRNKQVMMFTATLSPTTKAVCSKFMHNPLEILVDDMKELVLHGLTQYYAMIKEEGKLAALIGLLDKIEFNQVVIFTSSVERAKALCNILEESKFPAVCVYGSLDQKVRLERVELFRKFAARVMVSTDLLGRGIDVEGVNVVINFDMPKDSEQYLHRVGRAGRFGGRGLAVSYVANEDEEKILNQAQDKLQAKIAVLPEEIDQTVYSN